MLKQVVHVHIKYHRISLPTFKIPTFFFMFEMTIHFPSWGWQWLVGFLWVPWHVQRGMSSATESRERKNNITGMNHQVGYTNIDVVTHGFPWGQWCHTWYLHGILQDIGEQSTPIPWYFARYWERIWVIENGYTNKNKNWVYPLVNIQESMERFTRFNG
jgi:hypothetical protein